MRLSAIRWTVIALLVLAASIAPPAQAADPAMITYASMDLDQGELLLQGAEFGVSPQVFLGQSLGALQSLALVTAGTNEIVATLPAGTAPGTYLVVVDAGSGSKNIAMAEVTGGAVGPAGPAGADGQDGQDGAQGPPGPAGADGQNGLPRTKADVYQVIETSALCPGGTNCGIGAECLDANDIGMGGDCLRIGGDAVFLLRGMINVSDPTAPASQVCAISVDPAAGNAVVQALIQCIAVD